MKITQKDNNVVITIGENNFTYTDVTIAEMGYWPHYYFEGVSSDEDGSVVLMDIDMAEVEKIYNNII